MRSVTVAPKASPVAVARLGKDRSFTVNAPTTDTELSEVSGGKLTSVSELFADFWAERHQRVVMNHLNKTAVATGEGRDRVFADGQVVSDDELSAIITEQTAELVRLLIGERAAGGGRESAKAAAERVLAEQAASQMAMLRDMFASQTTKPGRALIAQMATGFGYTDLAAEFAAAS
jgi:hypothetical protein